MEEPTAEETDERMTDEDEEVSADLETESTAVETNPITELEAERDKLKDQLLRTAADYENFRKRSKREIADTIRRVREDVLRELLPIADNLQRAAESTASAKDIKSVAEGVGMVNVLLEETLGRFGITRFAAVGQTFDPNLHDAVQRQPTADQEPGTVVAEMMPGYMMGEKLLRPAMVVVAAPMESENVDAGSEALDAGEESETLVDRSPSEEEE